MAATADTQAARVGRGFHVHPLVQSCIAEGVGTFGLVFAGTGAVIIDAVTNGGVSHVGIAVTFGLIIFAMISAVGHISGAHFNPAVTIAFATAGHFPWRRVVPYLIGQIGGALLASPLLRALFGNIAHLGTTLPHGSDGQSFILEAVLTFFLMFVIFSVATDARAVTRAAAFAIGGTVGLEAMFAGPISGASMNPARSLAPALISGTWSSLWLYLLAPVLGAIAGAWAYRLISEGDDNA
ncbi:MAG: aquaporin [Thermomicrobia bacterium]|nr:aquaporin [Thermomicrobia bacterium]MCA1723630.1 aquaporin [Thermomicrobia bacterium]